MRDVTLKQRELARLHVLNNVLEYQIPIGQAAEILGVSERHTRRLLSSYGRDGAAVLAHGNRGREPHNAVLESEAAAVVRLARTEYAGTNHTHLTELLRERESIDPSRPTAASLVHELMEARDERRLLNLQRQLSRLNLLIIDELGFVPLSRTGAELLFEVFSQRYERGSILDFTQNPGKVMDDITFVRSHWWLVSEGFSLSTANSDVQKLPATLYHRIADSLAYAA